MARGEDRKAALIAELARARAQIGGAADGVRAQLDVGAKMERAVARNLWWWIAGAVLTGVVLAKLTTGRTKKVYVKEKGRKLSGSAVAETGFLLAVAKIVFDLARPILVKWASARVVDYVREKAGRRFGGA